jgi:integrase
MLCGRAVRCARDALEHVLSERGYVVHDPFQGLRFLEAAKQNTYNLTVEESLAIIDAAPEQWKVFFWLLAETGVRTGELAGLKLEGTDWEGGTVRIEHSVWQGKLQTPKTKKSDPHVCHLVEPHPATAQLSARPLDKERIGVDVCFTARKSTKHG